MTLGRRIVLLAVAAFVMAFMSAPAAWATDYHHGNNGEDHGSLCDHKDKGNHDDDKHKDDDKDKKHKDKEHKHKKCKDDKDDDKHKKKHDDHKH